jgi:ribosomal protein L12E/L44/L45/RPP1/RPP2
MTGRRITHHSSRRISTKGEIMKKLLAALVAVAFAFTAAAPAIAAERDKKSAEKAKKDEKKKDEKKKSGGSQAPKKSGYDQTKNKKQ